MGGQIVDATVVEARRPQLKGDEKAIVKGGGTPEGWSKAKAAQIDRDGRWTLKRGRKRPPRVDERVTTELVAPCFGYKNHVTIDRRHGFVRRYTVTHAAAHDGAQLAAVLDPDNTASGVWADTAYRSQENLGLAPWEWRGGIRTSCSREQSDPFHVGARFGRGTVAQGRVQPLPVVEHFHILEHRPPGPARGAGAGAMAVLLLERGKEALHRRVVEAVAAPAHRLPDAVPLQHATVGLSGVLGTPYRYGGSGPATADGAARP